MTHWRVVATLDRRDDPAWQESWQALVTAYTAPMQAYARSVLSRARGRAVGADEAAEMVQGFLASCVHKGWLSRADQDRGRFRAFLQALLKRYVLRVLRDASAQKRTPGPGRAVLPLHEAGVAGDPGLEVDDAEDRAAFDREWVEVALERARGRLRAHNTRYLQVIDDLVATDGAGSPGLAARLGLREQQLPVLRHRARERFAKMLVEELRATVADEQAFLEEWAALAPYLP